MTRLLAIETSSEACSVALNLDGELREAHEHAPLRHAELLLPAVRRLLASAEVPLSAVDAIAFGRGPGSFTSLRIGIGVVQGLAWGADLPVVPVSSLAAVAQQAAERHPGEALRIAVAVDARMDEVFGAGFATGEDGLVRLDGDEWVAAPEAAVLRFAGPFVAAGNGFERFPALAALAEGAVACEPGLWPSAAAVARLAAGWLRHNEPLAPALAQPVYIRDKVAEKPQA